MAAVEEPMPELFMLLPSTCCSMGGYQRQLWSSGGLPSWGSR
jgi:hypothetical protein